MAKVKTKYRNGGMVEKNSVLGWIADIIIYALLIVMMFICVIPLWYSLVASFSDGFTLYNSEGMIWFPVGEWTLAGYEHVFASNNVLRTLPSTMRKTTASGATASAMSAPPARSISKPSGAS